MDPGISPTCVLEIRRDLRIVAAMTTALALCVDWMAQAICRGRSELFFAPYAERPQARERREKIAASLCKSCPVHDQCLQYARDNREYGFWGGENELERHNAGFTLDDPIGLPRSDR